MKKTLLSALLPLTFAALCAKELPDVYLTSDQNKTTLKINNADDINRLMKEQGKMDAYEPLILSIGGERAVYMLIPKERKFVRDNDGYNFFVAGGRPEIINIQHFLEGKKDNFFSGKLTKAEQGAFKKVTLDHKKVSVAHFTLPDGMLKDIYIINLAERYYVFTAVFKPADKDEFTRTITNILRSFGLAELNNNETDNIFIDNVKKTPLKGKKTRVSFPVGEETFFLTVPQGIKVYTSDNRVHFACSQEGACPYYMFLHKLGSVVSPRVYENDLARWVGAPFLRESEETQKIGSFDVMITKNKLDSKTKKVNYNLYFNNGSNFVISIVGTENDMNRFLPLAKKILKTAGLE